MDKKKTNVISFVSKAIERGVLLKKPPTKVELKQKKIVEHEEDVAVFRFETDKDIVNLKVFKESAFLIFDFYDKETKSKYQHYEIDIESFYYMELALDKADILLKEMGTDGDKDRRD